MRLSIRFDTGDDRYRWLNTSLFVAEGRLLLGTGVPGRMIDAELRVANASGRTAA